MSSNSFSESDFKGTSQEDFLESQGYVPSHFDSLNLASYYTPSSAYGDDATRYPLNGESSSGYEEPSQHFNMRNIQALEHGQYPSDHRSNTYVPATPAVASTVRVEQELSQDSGPSNKASPRRSHTAKRPKSRPSSQRSAGVHGARNHTQRRPQTRSPHTARGSSRLQSASTSFSAAAVNPNDIDHADTATPQTFQVDSAQLSGHPNIQRRIVYQHMQGGLTKISCSAPDCTKSIMVDSKNFDKSLRRYMVPAKETSPALERYFAHDEECRRTLYGEGVSRDDMASFCLYKSRPHFVVESKHMTNQKDQRCTSSACSKSKTGNARCNLKDFVVDSASAS